MHEDSRLGSALKLRAMILLVLALAVFDGATSAESPFGGRVDELTTEPASFSESECFYRSAQGWLDDVNVAVASGEIADPVSRVIPPIPLHLQHAAPAQVRNLTTADIFPFEDTDQILLSDFSNGQLIDLMVNAANELLATHGDLYDHIGFWTNFVPHHTIGWAFYMSLFNDVTGIGLDTYDFRGTHGVSGENLEGFLMFWDVRRPGIQPGSGPEAEGTRSALAHEFAHRFAVFLPDLVDGRKMQGHGGFGCYTLGHWNQQVDGQGSAQGIAEWLGANPAVPLAVYPDFYLRNADTGWFFAYTELYMMGYVSPLEMDAGNGELRYMEDWDCASDEYYGPISSFSSSDIIAAAGPRQPDSGTEDKHYRTGWIMLHQPGDLPEAWELNKAIGVLEQQQADFSLSTLGRGTMDNSLFDDPADTPVAEPSSEFPRISAWPNPVHGRVGVRFSLQEQARIKIVVYDVHEREVRTLVSGVRGAGDHVVFWSGFDDHGSPVPAGVYFLRFSNGSEVRTQKLSWVR